MKTIAKIEIQMDDHGGLHPKSAIHTSDLGVFARATWLLHRQVDEIGLHVAIREHEAHQETQPDPNYQPFPGAWWCLTCQRHIPGQEVTHEETHDPRYGGCGQPVE